MGQSRVIVEVSPSALEVAVCRGREVISHRRIVLDKAEWPSAWQNALEELRVPLRECVAQLKCGGAPATVIYSAPGTFVGVHSCPAAASRAGAVQAARLSLASLVTFSLDSNPHAVKLLYADKPGKGDTSPPRLHAISAADADATVCLLTAWAEAAGLKVTSVTPGEAALTAAAVRRATAGDNPGGAATLWIGAHQSVLTVMVGKRLELVRTIGAGTEMLVDALMRPIKRRGEAEALSIDRAAARRLLSTIGIPGPQDALPDLPGCDGACILPLLQPVLQRLAIEIKQSLRFGVNEATRGAITFRLAGEGSLIPNLSAVLTRQAALSVVTEAAPLPSDEPRMTAHCAALGDDLVSLLGEVASDELMVKGLRRALAAGVCAAAALLAVEGVSVYATLAKERERLVAVKSSEAGTEALAGVQERALAARTASAALSRRVARTLGLSPDWSAVMGVIAERTPPPMRIVDATMTSMSGAPTCTLRGYVRADLTADAPSEIRRFVGSLSKEPLVNSVKLGVTQRSQVRSHDASTFELTLTLVGTPAAMPAGVGQTARADAGGDKP